MSQRLGSFNSQLEFLPCIPASPLYERQIAEPRSPARLTNGLFPGDGPVQEQAERQNVQRRTRHSSEEAQGLDLMFMLDT